MAKTIVWFCPGTWQKYGTGTNCQRLFDALLPTDRDGNRVTKFYDSGIGSSGSDSFRKFAGIFGFGLSRHIIDAYLKISKCHEVGDKIAIFGYSRGAFTARCIAGIITRFGLMNVDELNLLGPRGQRNAARKILRRYRADKPQEIEITGNNKVDFVGAFDTVNAVGVPINALRNTVEKIWRKLFGRRLWGIYDDRLSSKVGMGVQALALDETRGSFRPEVWKAAPNVRQRWFPGSHGNIGGGCAHNGQEHFPLIWMAEHAEAAGLRFDEDAKGGWQQAAITTSPLFNPRASLFGKLNMYRRRDVREGDIDETTWQRIKGVSGYRPRPLYPEGANAGDLQLMKDTIPSIRKRIWFLLLLAVIALAAAFEYNSTTGAAYELPAWLAFIAVIIPEANELTRILASWWSAGAATLLAAVLIFRWRVVSAEKEFGNLVWRNSLGVKNNGFHVRHDALTKRIRRYCKVVLIRHEA